MCVNKKMGYIMALNHDLQKNIRSLDAFRDLTIRILNNINEMTEMSFIKNGYIVLKSCLNSEERFCRPYCRDLFIDDPSDFKECYDDFCNILNRIKNNEKSFQEFEYDIVDQVVYTIQQSISIGMDLYINPNSARKHVGNRFEELISLIVKEIGLANKKIILKIPYDEKKYYRCETDFVFSKTNKVLSDSNRIDENEIVVSLKTSSKDRMGKIFIDKLLMSKFCKSNIKVIGIFLNDVQRKGTDSISSTFVSGLFMVYNHFLTELEEYIL